MSEGRKNNILITGSPGCGKTTVLLKLSEMLRADGYIVGGILSPEIRNGKYRSGFRIVDMLGGEGILSHVNLFREDVPKVSRYGINLDDLDRVSRSALNRHADVFIIDEIGPMELRSQVFISEVVGVLDSDVPVAASVHYRTSRGFAGDVKTREDTETLVLNSENRDTFPDLLHGMVSGLIRTHI